MAHLIYTTREALCTDALEIRNIIKKAICYAFNNDYPSNEDLLMQWLENKTVENIKSWINSENNISIVAYKSNGAVIGFSLINHSGHILLHYVLPKLHGLSI